LAEKIRMDGAKSAVNNYSDSDVNRFNAMVNDYNSRCGNFRYRSGELERARSDVESYRSQFWDEGRNRFTPTSQPSSPTYTPPTQGNLYPSVVTNPLTYQDSVDKPPNTDAINQAIALAELAEQQEKARHRLTRSRPQSGIATPAPAGGEGYTPARQEIESLYNQGRVYFKQLQENATLAASRDNWLKCINIFQNIYSENPSHRLAPANLYMISRVRLQMFDRFQVASDLDEAIAQLQNLAKLFPSDRLADDALFALGQLYLDNKKDHYQAAQYFRRVINEYPNGDMHTKATQRLQQLSQENSNTNTDPKIQQVSTFVPANAFVSGANWYCKEGFRQVGYKCQPVFK